MNECLLPDKPSELIKLALGDLRTVESLSDRYKVDMDYYHVPKDSNVFNRANRGKCLVCFAGAVMAQTLEVDIDESFLPADFDADTRSKLNALDHFRKGVCHQGFYCMGLPPDNRFNRYVPNYDLFPDRFHRVIEGMVKDLEAEGL